MEVMRYPDWNTSSTPRNATLGTVLLRGRIYSSCPNLSNELVTSKIINAAFTQTIDIAIAYNKTTKFWLRLNQDSNLQVSNPKRVIEVAQLTQTTAFRIKML